MKRKKLLSGNFISRKVYTLAWAGKHQQAISLATQELIKSTLPIPLQMDLLDLRAESYTALGKLELALTDASAMKKLASINANNKKLTAQALNRTAFVQMKTGDLQAAVRSAMKASKIKHSSRSIYAQSLFRLAEAQFRVDKNKEASESAQKAISIFLKIGDLSGAGRAYWALSNANYELNLTEDAHYAAQTALELAQKTGDQYGIGNAYFVLSYSNDLSKNLQNYQHAKVAFEHAGFIDRQVAALTNLAKTYSDLGLYYQAYHLLIKVTEIARDMGSKALSAYILNILIQIEFSIGKIDNIPLRLTEFEQLVSEIGDPVMEFSVANKWGDLFLQQGKFKKALQFQKKALKIMPDHTGLEVAVAEVHLANHNPVAALKITKRAIALHRARSFAFVNGTSATEIWWCHTCVLKANKKKSEMFEALDMTYGFLMEEIQNIKDVGLRRNYLNKDNLRSEILKFWLLEGVKRKFPKDRLYSYLNIESNTREPFARLTDTSQRLNALKTIPEIQTFLVEEATELSGGERVMLILQTGQNLKVAEANLPPKEEVNKTFNLVKRYLAPARLKREVQLIPPKKQDISRIISPLIAQNQIIGYLYVDMDSIYGLFDDTDRDMIGMLANQAAIALDNAGLVAELEQKVQERTKELQKSIQETKRLLKESNTLADVGRDISSSLNTKIVLENIATYAKNLLDGDLSALFLPENTSGSFRAIAAMGEHAEELRHESIELGNGILGFIAQNKSAEIINNTDNDPRAVMVTGTEKTHDEHLLAVPLLADDELKGIMAVWRTGKGREFTENELNFLANLAPQAVIALKNAQLFSETLEARALAEQANKVKSAFLANMSHELRTPLNAIINFTELVSMGVMGTVNEEQLEALGYSLTSSKHLLQLINDILDISKIQAGKLSLILDDGVDLQTEVVEVTKMIEPLLKKQAELYDYEVKLILDIDTHLPLVTCDRRRIRQVLLNLLSNSVKFTQKGSITLSIKQKPNHIQFAVLDTGQGISRELQTLIFEPFLQTPDGAKQVEGTGLGLPISRSLVEVHGGKIWLESEPGEGTAFFFTLPI